MTGPRGAELPRTGHPISTIDTAGSVIKPIR